MSKSRHRGTFVASHFGEEEMEILEAVVDRLEAVTGERNRANALRFIVRNFTGEGTPLGKSMSPIARRTAAATN